MKKVNWITGMHMKKGALTATAKAKGMTPAQFCSTHPGGKSGRRCNLRTTLMKFKHTK